LKAKSTKLFDRLAQLASTTATSTTASGAGAAAQAAATAAFMNISGRIRAGVGTNGPTTPVPNVPEKPEAGPPPFTEDDGRLNVDVAEKILKWHAEAVGRCVELSPPSDLWVFPCLEFILKLTIRAVREMHLL
jgi:exocyst complex component 5